MIVRMTRPAAALLLATLAALMLPATLNAGSHALSPSAQSQFVMM